MTHPNKEANDKVVAWRIFDGEGGYIYRSFEQNENYRAEFENNNPTRKGWVDALIPESALLAEREKVKGLEADVDEISHRYRKLQEVRSIEREQYEHQLKMLTDPIVRAKMLEPQPPIIIQDTQETRKWLDVPTVKQGEATMKC